MLAFLLVFSSILSHFDASPEIFNGKSWVSFDSAEDERDGKPPSIASESWKDPETEIFIGITHYRDKRCALTLKNLLQKAEHPDRLRIGAFLIKCLKCLFMMFDKV